MLSRKTVLSLLLMLSVSSILILVAELYAVPRILNPHLSRDQLLYGVMGVPGLVVANVEINNLGYTGDIPNSFEREEDELRVITLGGSTMFLRNMTEKLKRELSQRIPERKVQIIGAALPTHDSRLSVIKYEYLRRKFRTDYVAVYHGINDLWANNVPDVHFREDYSHVGPFHKRTWLLNNSLIARRLYAEGVEALKQWRHRGGRSYYVMNGAEFRSAQTLKDNLRSIINATHEDGAVPILMSFAWHLVEDYEKEKFIAYELGYSEREPEICCPVETWGMVEQVRDGLFKHNKVIEELAEESPVVFVDQYRALAEDIENFQDICHFSEIGAERFAKQLADAIATHYRRQSSPAVLAHRGQIRSLTKTASRAYQQLGE